MGRSSVTDQEGLRVLWAVLARDDERFATFLSDPGYVGIVGVSDEQGAEQLAVLEHVDPERLDELLPWLREQGTIGSPRLARFGGRGELAPILIRYARVFTDLERHFGPLHGFRILEVGSGFGGQAATIARHAEVARYTLVDLPEHLELAARYLASFELEVEWSFESDFPASADYDLVISNYAFSELTQRLQERYLKVFDVIPRGYMICNDIADTFELADRGFTESELLERLPFASRHHELPETHPANYVVVWSR